jgi:3-oxoacyl-[acyl-carrier protein] reductase
MDLGLQGKIALVTGASSGIGRETASLLAAEGAQTIVVGRRETLLNELASEIAGRGDAPPMTIVDDLNDRNASERISEKVLKAFGHLNILVNNLGQARPFTLETPDTD